MRRYPQYRPLVLCDEQERSFGGTGWIQTDALVGVYVERRLRELTDLAASAPQTAAREVRRFTAWVVVV